MTNLPMHHLPKKIESVQYNAAIAITGAVKRSSLAPGVRSKISQL